MERFRRASPRQIGRSDRGVGPEFPPSAWPQVFTDGHFGGCTCNQTAMRAVSYRKTRAKSVFLTGKRAGLCTFVHEVSVRLNRLARLALPCRDEPGPVAAGAASELGTWDRPFCFPPKTEYLLAISGALTACAFAAKQQIPAQSWRAWTAHGMSAGSRRGDGVERPKTTKWIR
jgi:hypothetical protein